MTGDERTAGASGEGATEDAGEAGLGFAARISLLYGALFIVYGAQLPYLPVWLDWRGLDAAQISLISALPLFVRLVATPSIAFIADRSGDHRRIIVVSTLVALAAGLALSQARGFWPILGCSLVCVIAIATVMPLAETVAMTGVRTRGLDYGRMRLWGSLTFIGASFLGGPLVDAFGPAAGMWLIVTGIAATVGSGLLLPRPEAGAGAVESTKAGRISPGDVLALVRSRPLLLFLVAATCVQSAHATFYTFGALHWRAQGLASAWTGLLWAIGVLAEVALFAWSARVVSRFGAVKLLLAGAAAGVLRWTAMALDPPLALLLPLQALHGLTYGAAHLGAIHFIATAVPERQAGTAQALYATVTAGIGMAGAMLISGRLYAGWGGRTYLAMALIAAIGLVAGLALRRTWSGDRITEA